MASSSNIEAHTVALLSEEEAHNSTFSPSPMLSPNPISFSPNKKIKRQVSISIENLSLAITQYHDEPGQGNGATAFINKLLPPVVHKYKQKVLRGKVTESVVLHNISVNLRAGRLIAVMGPSGCGKTSLLNAIAGRISGNSSVTYSGNIRFNGELASDELIQNTTGYVLQGDFLHPNLTVRETLQCSAMLKLSSKIPREDKLNTVEEVIRELGLVHCANTRTGDERQRGLSGGEKRRVSIGMQMLTNPSVLMLDEPTSGLDSFMAHNVMETLRKLAREGRTVICTIHQPRSDIFHMFDDVLLLSKGETLYFGESKEVAGYFGRLGFVCPPKTNPADFILDIASIDNRNLDTERESRVRVQRLITLHKALTAAKNYDENTKNDSSSSPDYSRNSEEYNSEVFYALESGGGGAVITDDRLLGSNDDVSSSRLTAVDTKPAGNIKPKKYRRKGAAWYTQMLVLVVRSIRNLYRDKPAVVSGLVESVVMGLLLGAVFYQLAGTLDGIKARMAAFYAIISLQSYIIMTYNTYRLCQELPVFDRERQDNQYRLVPYFLAHNFASFPLDIISPIIFSTILYVMVGFRPEFESFMLFMTTITLAQYCSISWSWLAASVTRSFAWASLFANAITIMCGMSTGFVVNSNTYPGWIDWFKFIDPLKWGFELLLINEFSGRKFECPNPENANWCLLYDGDYNLKRQGIDDNNIMYRFLTLTAITIFFRICALFILRLFPRKPSMVSSSPHAAVPPPLQRHYNTFSDNIANFTHPLKIELNNLSVSVSTTLISSATLPTTTPTTKTDKNEKVGGSRGGSSGGMLRMCVDAFYDVVNPNKRIVQNTILRNVKGSMETGQLIVLMGGSGSGKTTLLNVIAGRLVHGDVQGDVVMNNIIVDDQIRQGLTSYVMQNDYLYPHLTVRETLNYAALLRLPPSLTTAEKLARVTTIITELGLKDCADTLIGDDTSRGISGGEKRRVTIAMQMLTDPCLLLLDEPTSGLDSFNAHNIIDTLKKIARRGRIILCSIHQPRSDIFHLFDKVILLTRGDVAYFGDQSNVLEYFNDIGFPCPEETNPADYLLDITSIDARDQKRQLETTAAVAFITNKWVNSHLNTNNAPRNNNNNNTSMLTLTGDVYTNGEDDVGDLPLLHSSQKFDFGVPTETLSKFTLKAMRPFYHTLPVLLRRTFTNMARTPLQMLARIMQAIAFAAILCTYYTPMTDDENSVQNRTGFLYMCTSCIFLGMLNSSSFFPPERNMFYREAADGSHSSVSFYLTYLISELPYDGFMAVVFTVMVHYVIGIDITPEKLAMFTFVMFCLVFAGESIGALLSAVIYDVGFATSLATAIMSFFGTMSGFLSNELHPAISWLNSFSIIRHASLVLAVDHFSGLTFNCGNNPESCPIHTGEQALSTFGFNPDEKWNSFGWIIGLTVAYRLLGVLALTAVKKRFSQ